jgi:hypothetical protein
MHVERIATEGAFREFLAAGPHAALVGRRLGLAEPFWRRAAREAFVLRQGPRVVGRIIAVADHGHDRAHHDGAGFFGWMQCPDDLHAARALTEAAAQWLRDRGYRTMRGPIGLGLGEELGAVLEGYPATSSPLLPDAPRHLPGLFARLGARLVLERHGYAWNRDEVPPPAPALRAFNTRGEVIYRTLDHANRDHEARRFLAAYNASNASRWGFVPMTPDEAVARVRDVLAFGDPRLVWLAEVRGEPAGVVVALPVLEGGALVGGDDEGPLGAVAGSGRRAVLRGLRGLRAALDRRRVERAHLVTVATDPRFRDLHVGAQLLLRVWRAALDLGVREAELGGIDAKDEPMHTLLWRLGCRRIRRYGLYELPLR